MACYHPLHALARTPFGSNKKEIVFPMADVPYMWKDGHLYNEKLLIPCGQCIGCRMDYSKQWAIRCALEAQQWEHNWFVTLTYNDDFVPLNSHYVCDELTGEVLCEEQVMTLVPDDLKNYIKRLRKYFKYEYDFDGIRFYACGEYGPKNMRPHFHLILFNCPLPDGDLTLHHVANGYSYYKSKILQKAWEKTVEIDGKSVRVPIGFVQVCDFSYESASYVARYMLKKHKGKDADFYEKAGIAPEFTRCSRRPGIASAYFEQHKDEIYKFDEVNIIGGKGKVLKVHPPSYYDRLFDVDSPEMMKQIKDERKERAELNFSKELQKTSLSESEYLAVKESVFRDKIKKLKRSV